MQKVPENPPSSLGHCRVFTGFPVDILRVTTLNLRLSQEGLRELPSQLRKFSEKSGRSPSTLQVLSILSLNLLRTFSGITSVTYFSVLEILQKVSRRSLFNLFRTFGAHFLGFYEISLGLLGKITGLFRSFPKQLLTIKKILQGLRLSVSLFRLKN